MDSQALEEIGLTAGESRVYLSLLKLGKSTIGNILRDSQASNSKIYDILDRLGKKGLVSTISFNGRKYFEAKNPLRLNEFIVSKEELIKVQKAKLEASLPSLMKIYSSRGESEEAEILQGLNGIKTFTEMILEKLSENDTFYILGAPKEATMLLSGYFEDWHKRRTEKKVKCKILYNQEAKEFAPKRALTPLTEVRLLPKEIKSPTLIDIGKDYVATMLFGEKPLCFVIKNKKIAESYLDYFNLLWKRSKQIK
ncbi:MAG: helix-turn-helix domain-containing protein [archaeon]